MRANAMLIRLPTIAEAEFLLRMLVDARLNTSDLFLYPSSSQAHSSVTIALSLARLAVEANKPDVAAERYLDALRSAWWCWEAYDGLCALGEDSSILVLSLFTS